MNSKKRKLHHNVAPTETNSSRYIVVVVSSTDRVIESHCRLNYVEIRFRFNQSAHGPYQLRTWFGFRGLG